MRRKLCSVEQIVAVLKQAELGWSTPASACTQAVYHVALYDLLLIQCRYWLSRIGKSQNVGDFRRRAVNGSRFTI